MRAAAPLLALLLVPAGAAVPVLWAPAPGSQEFLGVAAQGSADRSEDFPLVNPFPFAACLDVEIPYSVTLELLSGAPEDVLRIEALDGRDAEARLGQPATVLTIQRTSCPPPVFTVVGATVADTAAYRAHAVCRGPLC